MHDMIGRWRADDDDDDDGDDVIPQSTMALHRRFDGRHTTTPKWL